MGELEDIAAETGADCKALAMPLRLYNRSTDRLWRERLPECLILQVRVRTGRPFPEIIAHHLSHLERRNHQAIARAGNDGGRAGIHRMLQDLEPRPGDGGAGH